jgi:hypothetical protein
MPGNIFSEILIWSKQLAPWQNEAIRRLFKKPGLLATDKDEIFREAQIEYGFLPALPKAPDLILKSSDLSTPPLPGQKINLKGLRECVPRVLRSATFHMGTLRRGTAFQPSGSAFGKRDQDNALGWGSCG